MDLADLYAVRRARFTELVDGPRFNGVRAEIARRIGRAPAQVSQWIGGYRSITEESRDLIEQRCDLPKGWLDQSPTSPPAAGVAHEMILSVYTVPRLEWEALMQKEDLPAEFETKMPDASMAPDIPAGARIIFITGVQPMPGDYVLVRDGSGDLYVREFRQLRPGQWQAHPANPAFLTLESERDGLVVAAVFNGVLGRRARG